MSERKPPSQKMPGPAPSRTRRAIRRASSPRPTSSCSNRASPILCVPWCEAPRCGKRKMPSSPPRRLTVLQVIPALDTGGAERTTVDIAAALCARGDRALAASLGGRMEAELAAAGGELIRLPVGSKNPVRMLANAARLARLARGEHVDIIHARSRAPAWAALIACRVTGLPFVTTYHGSYGESGALKRFYNSVMARGDVVIANSR